MSEQRALEAKTASASSEAAAKDHRNTAKSHSDNSYSYYTKSHTSAEKSRISAGNADRSATAAADSASAAAQSAVTAKNHADAARQDYTNLNNSLNAHKIEAENRFNRIDRINHQQDSGSFELNRETINPSGPWVKDLVLIGGTCFFRFWVKITEYHNESSGWVRRNTHGAEFLLIHNRYQDRIWETGSTRTFHVHNTYGIRNAFDQIRSLFGINVTSTHIQIQGHETSTGRIELDVRQNRKKFSIKWHTLG